MDAASGLLDQVEMVAEEADNLPPGWVEMAEMVEMVVMVEMAQMVEMEMVEMVRWLRWCGSQLATRSTFPNCQIFFSSQPVVVQLPKSQNHLHLSSDTRWAKIDHNR